MDVITHFGAYGGTLAASLLLYNVMVAAGEWAQTRLKAVLLGSVLTFVAWAVVATLVRDLLASIAEQEYAPREPAQQAGYAVAVLLVSAAYAGFRRSTFFRPMSLDRAARIIEQATASLARGQSGGAADDIAKAVRRFDRLPLDPDYRARLVQLPGVVAVQDHIDKLNRTAT